MRGTRWLAMLLAASLATACGDKDGGDPSDGDGDGNGADGGDGGTDDGEDYPPVEPERIACAEYCEKDDECYGDETLEDCLEFCTGEGHAEPSACLDLLRELNLCLANLGCDDFKSYWNSQVGDPSYPCRDEDIAFDEC